MRKRVCLILLAIACVIGCVALVMKVRQPTVPEKIVVAYVPLDDRPLNTERVAYLAAALNYDLRMPEEDLYRTRLDFQPRNDNGTAYGDRAALFEWICQQEAEGCDRYILSLDQLLSGGLVNSRSYVEAEIVLSDGTVLTEYQMIDRLLELLSDEENEVYLLDTVMRLAATIGYDGGGLNEYNAMRAYGMKTRPTLSGTDLTVETITSAYGMDENNKPLRAYAFRLKNDQVEKYHASRARKLSLIDYALTGCKEMEHVHVLIGVDDSASTNTIQTNELAYLRHAVEGKGTVLSGADELGMMAVCKMYAQQGEETPRVNVRYFGGNEEKAANAYDHQNIKEVVEHHLSYLGAVVQGTEYDLELLVLTAPADSALSDQYIDEVIKALQENQESGMPTILIDASERRYGENVRKRLVKETDLGFLLGYAGFHDSANSAGVSVANGLGRWLCLSRGEEYSLEQRHNFLRTLGESVIKDLCYMNDTRLATIEYVTKNLKGDPDNFYRTNTDSVLVMLYAEKDLEMESKAVLKNLSESHMLVSLDGETATPGTVTLSDLTFPWYRVFEIRMTIHITPNE